jgi:RHH-type proline utilization regulon transcriptional repressor/proline dehydrogenase/delta 1-pyrroline-5-carboxylate dehydrogenase
MADTEVESGTANDLELRTRQIGAEVLQRLRDRRPSPLSPQFWTDRVLDWSMQDPRFQVQLFRFVDVFPALRSAAEIHEYLDEYLAASSTVLPPTVALGLKAGQYAKGLLGLGVGQAIRSMAATFIAGESPAAALPLLRRLWNAGMAFSVDLLGEASVSPAEAAAYRQRYLELLATLPQAVAAWPANPRLESDHLGRVPRVNLSLKLSALDPRVDAIDFAGSAARLQRALRPILESAAREQVAITFDMEQYALKDLTIDLFERSCAEIEFPAGLALQAYLRSAEQDARRVVDWARRAGRQVSVRLIKGAYWDYEVAHADRMGWPVPVWTRKAQTDACFERVAAILVDAIPRAAGEPGVKLAVGSHNLRSIARVLALVEARGLPPSAVEVQMLYGMADTLKTALVTRGLRVRQYVPVGPMIPGMAYLVRRLLENASNQSWLRTQRYEQASEEELLAAPETRLDNSRNGQPEETREEQARRHALTPPISGLAGAETPFFNEPQRDFADRRQREEFAAAVENARVPEVANDATTADADQAAARAVTAFRGWRDTPPRGRAALLLRTAQILRQRRDELSGIVLREAGKPWRDADADVCEAIDLCEFYARAAVWLMEPRSLGRLAAERNETWFEPRGPAVVISPWNFPLAICTGMTAAALVTGNPVIVKPAEQTPGTALRMCGAFWEAGVPRDVLQFLPGVGEVVGAALVRDPRVALIAFTGSKEVGLEILAAAARVGPGQGFVKQVVCEMGGKNAILIDESADLDEAVPAVRLSAFGYAGQKCSACSRVIVVRSVCGRFLRRLIEATQALVIGDPLDPATDVGPVIDEAAAARIREYLDIGRREGLLELACPVPERLAERLGRPFIGPHIFSGIRPDHRLAQEEIFGPVLSVLEADNFDHALEVANSTGYRLTGGVFSRKPSHLEAARRRFRVGNLYLNRAITGALVGRQPFGGFGLSGTGTQAGSIDYLRHFLLPRACAENTMRHGFAPGVTGE